MVQRQRNSWYEIGKSIPLLYFAIQFYDKLTNNLEFSTAVEKLGKNAHLYLWVINKYGEGGSYRQIERDTICTAKNPFPAVPFGQIVDPGVKGLVSELINKQNGSFDAAFSRSIKSLVDKKLIDKIETRSWAKTHQRYGIALTKKGQKALKLISSLGELNNKK